ncbi:hypothetical protein [Psychroserpens sp. SPM9]|uniref:hypothetical protein n=1 Tax=Psychroserpens sp. SPM9 TaxID=2975598 RepID=UPI0021A846A1|nr:hypothetical protein [Psychroserpens sp. SPM9]MDG5491405.1 hypothetical protein [Psychroserpens sp. SPM9]
MSRKISYILVLIGGIVAIYAQAGEAQSPFVLIGGIAILMIGIYSLSRGIPSKNDSEDDNSQNTL